MFNQSQLEAISTTPHNVFEIPPIHDLSRSPREAFRSRKNTWNQLHAEQLLVSQQVLVLFPRKCKDTPALIGKRSRVAPSTFLWVT